VCSQRSVVVGGGRAGNLAVLTGRGRRGENWRSAGHARRVVPAPIRCAMPCRAMSRGWETGGDSLAKLPGAQQTGGFGDVIGRVFASAGMCWRHWGTCMAIDAEARAPVVCQRLRGKALHPGASGPLMEQFAPVGPGSSCAEEDGTNRGPRRAILSLRDMECAALFTRGRGAPWITMFGEGVKKEAVLHRTKRSMRCLSAGCHGAESGGDICSETDAHLCG